MMSDISVLPKFIRRPAWLGRAGPGRRLLRRLAVESPGLFVIGVATALGQSALLVPIAWLVRHLFDHDITRNRSGGIVLAGLVIVVLYLASSALGYLSRRAVLRTTTAVAARLRRELVSKLYALSQGWQDRQRSGMVHSLIIQDSERVEGMLGDLANPLLPAVLVTVTLTIVALVLSPVLFLAVVTVVPAFMVLSHVLAKRTRAQGRLWMDATHALSAEVHLKLRAMMLTRVEGAEAWELQRGREVIDDLARHAQGLGVARASHAAVQAALGAVTGSLVLVVGGIAVTRGSLSLGELLAFYAVLGLLVRQLQQVGNAGSNIAVGLDSLDRLELLLETPAEDPYPFGTRTLDFRGAIALQDVTFAYSAEPVLHEVSLAIGPSERVAILGPNGAGKSTLVSLMVGLYRPQSGRVLADDVAFEELDMTSLRRQVGVVLQDPVLFPGTIRENIAYGTPRATDAEIRAAAATATAHDFIDRLPDGYETRVGDDGVGLSGGQRQRVAVARALLGEPGLLLLDEPTTYLDEAGVSALTANLSSLPRAPTVVLVTHDPHVAGHADRTIELRDGVIVADSAAATSR